MNTQTNMRKSDVLAGVKVVDTDTHICEPYDLWTSRAPAKYKDRVPQVKEWNGELCWVIDGDHRMGPAFPVSTIRRDGSKGVGMDLTRWKFEDAFEASYDVSARLAFMDQAGIHAHIAYPNLLGFGNQKAMMVDEDLRLATTQIYNDAMIEMQAESGDRILPMPLVPWWNIKDAVAETERCHRAGLRGINTATCPEKFDFPVLADRHWYPLWELCEATGLPVNFHIGAGFQSTDWFGTGAWKTHQTPERLAVGGATCHIPNLELLSNIIVSGMLDVFPALKIVSAESGAGWIPHFLEAIEYNLLDAGVKRKHSPLEVFQRQIYACSWFERRDFVHSLRTVGVDNVMFQTDFPHPACVYPDPLAFMHEVAEQLEPEESAKFFGGNAMKVYNIAA